jgi:hypothetical protein
MKPASIKVGRTYRNRGKGKTTRKVLEISDGLKPVWWAANSGADQRVVRFEQNGRECRLYLTSFAKWVGSEVEERENSD